MGMFYQASKPNSYPWIYSPEKRGKSPFPQYVGVKSSYHTMMTKQVLQLFTGEKVEIKMDDDDYDNQELSKAEIILKEMKKCKELNKDQNIFNYVYVVGDTSCYNVTSVSCGQCLKTTVFTSLAASPIMKQHQSWQNSPLNFPTWTESVWKTINAKMFLRGNKAFEHGIFSLGLITSTISFILVYIINKNAEVVFAEAKKIELDKPVPVEM